MKSSRYIYDKPNGDPRASRHWESLSHQDGDKLINNVTELVENLQQDLTRLAGVRLDDGSNDSTAEGSNSCNSSSPSLTVALWTVLCGYCEALTTHKESTRRSSIFPIPIDALRRLVQDEFVPFLHSLDVENSIQAPQKAKSKNLAAHTPTSKHRMAVRHVSNAVWSKAQSKSLNLREELHANSLYVCFRGHIDKKSLDCFGAATITILGCQYLGYQCYLTLSEDHAYESHRAPRMNSAPESSTNVPNDYFDTCEVAIPGNSKQVQQKRGLPIEETMKKDKPNLTPETSWLYMRRNPVICTTIPMMIAAVISNINCTIGGIGGGNKDSLKTPTTVSVPLYQLKRDLLWCLYDGNYLTRFPFALIELGDCEDHCTSPRGEASVPSPQLTASASSISSSSTSESKQGDGVCVLQLEQLFIEAIESSRRWYMDSQTYVYFYAAHYHKDAGLDLGIDQEYRLVESIRLYAQASRVASQYTYDSKDSLYLMKHMTIAASLIFLDILTTTKSMPARDITAAEKTRGKTTQAPPRLPRLWHSRENAIAAGTWILAFFDSLFFWEEQCGLQKSFVEICSREHKYSLSNLFQTFVDQSTRQDIVECMFRPAKSTIGSISSDACSDKTSDGTVDYTDPTMTYGIIDGHNLLYFFHPRSMRLKIQDGLLIQALVKKKVVIGDMELAMTISSGSDGRRAKRARR